jgi:hypothetical protein
MSAAREFGLHREHDFTAAVQGGGGDGAAAGDPGLAGRAAAVRMQERPEAAISAGLTAIESVERRTVENRRVRYAAVVDRG